MDVTFKNLEGNEEENFQEDEETSPVSHKTKSYGISIDSGLIPSVPVEEQAAVLRNLGVNVFNQDEFEEGVLKQVDEAIAVKETEEIVKGWEKNLKAVDEDIRIVENDLLEIDQILKRVESKSGAGYESWRRTQAVQKQKDNKLRQLKKLQATQKALHHKLGIGNEEELEQQVEFKTSDGNIQNMSENRKFPLVRENLSGQDALIKTGEMTPFGGTIPGNGNKVNKNNFGATDAENSKNYKHGGNDKREDEIEDGDDDKDNYDEDLYDAEYVPDEGELKYSWFEHDERNWNEDDVQPTKSEKQTGRKRSLNVAYVEEDSLKPKKKKKKKTNQMTRRRYDNKPVDDGNEKLYRQRIREWRISELLKKRGNSSAVESGEEEYPDVVFDKGLKIPGKLWDKLYKYQQTGVKWLWELHCQQAGGIIGDEMGLGKTVQMIVFLAGLKYSKISARKKQPGLGPVLIVCPVTVLHQWVQEFHKWWPEFRVAVLHETGSYQGFKQELIKKMCKENGVLVTSFAGIRQHQDHLLAQRFDYVILDEGHKIRNPDAEITLACKQFRTCHRIILSGSPMQNNLRELWSLFDFVFPGKLGTLPVFMTEFSVPITMGGYCNATKVQVETAYKCACVLRDTINPYLLRRLKKDVNMSLDLPAKNEQVLFCRLSQEQRELYQQYLDSKEVQAILAGNYKVFPGLIMLRKICNHPDLTSTAGSLLKAKQDAFKAELGERAEEEEPDPDDGYGDPKRSGKMIVVEALLKMWQEQGHRVLLFSQTRQMLNILEKFVEARGYRYFRLDGSTPVASRQPLITNFNEDRSIFLFILTTRVGGLGVNLVGADRIIIYDPDWNPSTDTQARERAWRIGQKKDVTIYRLITSGTIEEKIYHRQIFKQFLTNRVLKDPKQRRFFKSNDLYELFTLDNCDVKYGTETSAIFAGSNCEVKLGSRRRKKREAEQTKAVKRQVDNEETKKSKKVEIEKDAQISGGAFSIDWRDIAETQSLSQDKESKKEGQEASKEVYVESVGEKSSAQDGLIDEGKEKKSGENDELVNEDLAAKAMLVDSYDVEKEESTSASSKQDEAHIQIQTSEQFESKRENTATIAENDNIPKEDNQGSLEKETGHVLKKGKKNLSSLSDNELTKKVKRKKKKKRMKRKRQGGVIDGQHIDHLDHSEIYNSVNASQSSAEEMEEQKQQNTHQDEFILKHLFKKSGVHSALKHDVIMEASNPDYALIETEANRVAEHAVKALKRSRQLCLSANRGVPTWTGVSGSSGLTEPAVKRPRFGQKKKVGSEEAAKSSSTLEVKPHFSGDQMGMSSSSAEGTDPVHSSQLLAKMRARNNILPSNETGHGNENDDLILQIRTFIASQGTTLGQATTQEILDEFRSKLPSNETTLFRSMLRQICTFTRDSSSGKGIWILNEEFR